MAQSVNVTFKLDEVSADPFYSKSNINYLEGIAKDIRDGKAHFTEHELIED